MVLGWCAPAFPVRAVLAVLLLAAPWGVASAAEAVLFEVVDPDAIYFGEGKNPKAPGVMTADDVWAEIPEYKQIVEEELTDNDPKYHLLLAKATERFNKALKKLAKRDGHDVLGEVGAIEAKGETEVPDVTDEMIKLVTRD